MTDLTSYTVPALKLLAKQKGLKGYADLNKTNLIQLISTSETSATSPIPAGVTDSVGQPKPNGSASASVGDVDTTVPPNLKRPITPESKAHADKVADDTRTGKREYVMPKTSARAQMSAKKQGIRRSSAEKMWEAKDKTKGTDALPKQAQVIVKFLRSYDGPVAFPLLAEKCATELKTKQDPKRILQFYHGKLIQEGFLRVTAPEKK